MKKGRTAAEINFAETARIRYELAQVKGELMQAQKDVAEVWAENARLTASYQDDADAVCEVLGVEWTKDDEYPAVTLSAIAQLQAELAEAQIDKKLVQQDHLAAAQEIIDLRTELAQAQTEAAQLGTALADVCAARDALTQERDRLKASHKRLARIAYKRGESLAQARAELAAVDEALGKYHIPDTEDHGAYCLQAELTAVKAVARTWFKKAMRRKKELNCEAEELRGQLAHTQRQLAAASEAAEWLWGFYDGNTLIAKPGYEDEISEAWGKLLIAADSTPSALQLQERLTTLDAAEAALADCGIGGIFAEFGGLPDAIEQMAQHIKELTSRLTQAQADLDAEPIEVEITGKEMVEALQEERQLRREAEAQAELQTHQAGQRTENLQQEKVGVHRALDECRVPRGYDDGKPASSRTRILWLNQRAEMLEQECNRWRGDWESVTAEILNMQDRLAAMKQRAERAEALAALVNKKTAVLLERLAWLATASAGSYEARLANELAAKILEALDDSQA